MKAVQKNPFHLSGYTSPAYFCDRKTETETITEAVLNGRNLTLISLRRMGKTGLIHHVFYGLQKQKVKTIYLDIYGTTCLEEFVREFGRVTFEALISKMGQSFQNALKTLKGSSIKVVINPNSGLPELDFSFNKPEEVALSMEKIFDLIENSKESVVIALDEFQQISTYPEKNTEAILRSHIQRLTHVSFIFSGSSKTLLTNMFTAKNRPFYQSTQMLYLGPIDARNYQSFIVQFFKKAGRDFKQEAIHSLFSNTRRHTFYVQYLCNRLYASVDKKIGQEQVSFMLQKISEEQEPVFFNYRSLLTTVQFNILKAIALEDVVEKPLANSFLAKHMLGSASTVSSALKVLIENDMLYRTDQGVFISDVFFKEWLASKFKHYT